MRRIVFDFRTPHWTKWGVIVFCEAVDREQQIADATGPKAVVEIVEDRDATPEEIAKHEVYQAWLNRWLAAAKTASAGRHMAHPWTTS